MRRKGLGIVGVLGLSVGCLTGAPYEDCDGAVDTVEITVGADGAAPSFAWDGGEAAEIRVLDGDEVVWGYRCGSSGEGVPEECRNALDCACVPNPVSYGDVVEALHVTALGPEPAPALEPGRSYTVSVRVFAATDDASCGDLATGEATWTSP